MASGFDVRPPSSRHAARAMGPSLHNRGTRLLFALALLTFGLASSYTAIALLARVTPALFPGQTLTITIAGVDVKALPGISRPGRESSFNNPINLLIIGVDKRPGYRDEGNLTDTIMVATIDPVGKTVNLLSFPRDMLIDIHLPNGFVYGSRINESYGTGWRNGGNSFEAGTKQMKLDLQKNFGIEIDHTVLLDFKGVESLINAIDGVEADIPYELSVPDWWYSDDDISAHWVSFPPGPQHLDGYNAVAFGRYRNDSDFLRVKRQQLVVQAALQKVFARGLLNDWMGLWDAYSDTVKTDMPKSKMGGLVPLLKQTQGRVKAYSLGDPVNGVNTVTGHQTDGGASVLLWDRDNVQYWLSQTFTKAAYVESYVEIQNGYGIDGEARAAALGRYLAYSKGLPTVSLGPDTAPQPSTTIVLYGEDRRPMAEDIARWMNLPPSSIRVMPRNGDSDPDVVIIIGHDFQLPGG